jgi:hypothetical protein
MLTARDELILSYVGIARYASARQLHLLVADGLDKTVVYRRLRKLSGRRQSPESSGYLRRLEYRRADGIEVPVWALTPAGRVIAEARVPYLHPPSKSDVGHVFLEHTLRLNDVLLGLVLALRKSELAPLHALPFRWFCEGDELLQFEIRDAVGGRMARRVVKPDAILEVPGGQRRLFLEAESGAHSIATADPVRQGPVLRKLERYRLFFTGRASGGGARETNYARSFPDDFAPELVFLVHSDARKARVRAAVKETLGTAEPAGFGVRVLTFAEGSSALRPVIRGEPSAPPARQVAIDGLTARQLRDGYNALAEALEKVRRAAAEHGSICTKSLILPPPPLLELQALRDIIQYDLLGEPRPAAKKPVYPLDR